MNLEFKLQNAVKNSKKIETLLDKILDVHNNVPNGDNLKYVVKKNVWIGGREIIPNSHLCWILLHFGWYKKFNNNAYGS